MKIKKMKINKIKIYDSFIEKAPGDRKMARRWRYYRETGELYVPIVINKEGYLVDGYTSYIIAMADGLKKYEVIIN